MQFDSYLLVAMLYLIFAISQKKAFFSNGSPVGLSLAFLTRHGSQNCVYVH